MHWSKLITASQRLAGRVDTALDARCEEWLNEAIQRWILRDPWQAFTMEEDFVADGTRDLYLPSYVKKVLTVFDKTNKLPVHRKENWDRDIPIAFAEQTAGQAYYWRDMGQSPVFKQPSSPTKFIFNTDATFNVYCYMEGLVENAAYSGTAGQYSPHQETITLLSGADTQTQKTYAKVLTLGKTNLHGFDVNVFNLSSSILYSRIEASSYRAAFEHIQLSYIPPAGTLFTIRFIRRCHEYDDDQTTNPAPPGGINPSFLKWYTAGCIHASAREHKEAEFKWHMAESILRDEERHEKTVGDQDMSMQPDPLYWEHESGSAW